MRRAFFVIVVCGCASAAPTSEEAARRPPIFDSNQTGTIVGEKPRAVTVTIAMPPAAIWLAVRKTYADFEIPVTVDNPAARQIGNPSFFKSRQLAGRPMERFVDCGNGMTGLKASTYRIYMSLLTDVIPDDHGGANVQTTFIPVGQDMSGGAGDRISCGSSGKFEALFLDRVRETLGK